MNFRVTNDGRTEEHYRKCRRFGESGHCLQKRGLWSMGDLDTYISHHSYTDTKEAHQ
jgi:hypothetical protein